MLFVDTDNALGSSRGDVDDAYAIAALICGGAEIVAVSACAGNTDEARALENNKRLCALLEWRGSISSAAAARVALRTFPGRVVALGPLTNVAAAAYASEVIVIGGTLHTRGRWPPFWPHEFNLTKDLPAARRVFDSAVPLTIFPLDVARKLCVRKKRLDDIRGALGQVLRRESERWFRHLRFARMTGRFPIYDLAAALYAIDEEGFTMEQTTAVMERNGLVRFGRGTRAVKVCTKLNAALLWDRFVRSTARELPSR